MLEMFKKSMVACAAVGVAYVGAQAGISSLETYIANRIKAVTAVVAPAVVDEVRVDAQR